MSDLRSQIDSLSPAEKAELLDTVWESLEADAASLTDAQRAELDYRIARHEQNNSDVISWEQVRAGLFKKPETPGRLDTKAKFCNNYSVISTLLCLFYHTSPLALSMTWEVGKGIKSDYRSLKHQSKPQYFRFLCA